jgi:hypothetical protein
MRFSFIISVWLLFSASAFGFMADIPVSPKNLNQGVCVFSVSANATNGGTSFYITVTARTNTFLHWVSGASVSTIDHFQNGFSISSAEPTIPIKFMKGTKMCAARFTVSNERLGSQDLYFILEVPVYVTDQHGNVIPIASGEIYELKLRDFLKP